MPPRIKITKADILSAALDILGERGKDAVNARAIALRLGCSTQPIYSNYSTMNELRRDIIASVLELFEKYRGEDISSGEYPIYKAIGMSYIRFAKEEREFFKLIFMYDRLSSGDSMLFTDEIGVETVSKNVGLTKEAAEMFHAEMWVCVHGIAAMFATGFFDFDKETVSKMLTDIFEGLKMRYAKEGTV